MEGIYKSVIARIYKRRGVVVGAKGTIYYKIGGKKAIQERSMKGVYKDEVYQEE